MTSWLDMVSIVAPDINGFQIIEPGPFSLWAVLYVVYTVREEETIRIISARKAVHHEQKQYREANH